MGAIKAADPREDQRADRVEDPQQAEAPRARQEEEAPG